MELEALAGAVVELSERLGVSMPYTRTAYSLATLLAQSNALRKQAVP
jgi:ketopantoate reductase